MEPDTNLASYRQKVLKDLPFLYVFGIVVCGINFVVGVIWQSIDISSYGSGNLELPYFGGYIMLASTAMTLIFVYNLISLKNDGATMKYERRFQLTLSMIILIATLVLAIILGIRANDYRQTQSLLTRLKYGTAILSTVGAIFLTIVAVPVYLHIFLISFNTVKLTPDDKQQSGSDSMMVGQQQPQDVQNQQEHMDNQARAGSKQQKHQQQLVPKKKGSGKESYDCGSQPFFKQTERGLNLGQVELQKKQSQPSLQSQKEIVLSQQVQKIQY